MLNKASTPAASISVKCKTVINPYNKPKTKIINFKLFVIPQKIINPIEPSLIDDPNQRLIIP